MSAIGIDLLLYLQQQKCARTQMEGVSRMADQALVPDPTCLHLPQLEAEGKVITVTVKTTAV